MNENGVRGGRRPTMRDVAARAGVSFKTVSRVVNGEPGVTPATSAKVEEAVAALRFERNDLARSLRPGHRTHTLGLVIEDLSNPFFSGIAQGVERVAQAHGYLLMIASTRADAELERELVTTLMRRRIDGLMLVPMIGDHRYISGPDGIDAVYLDRPPSNVEADAVLVDNVGGIERAVEHLVEQGHRRIAFIGCESGIYSTEQRLLTFRRSMLERVGEVDERLIVNENGLIADAEVAHAEAAVRALMERPPHDRPTAILTGAGRATVGALNTLHTLRGTQPAPALVGFDELELGELLGVTVVRTQAFELGRLAAELVLERINGRVDGPQQIIVPTELVPRGSGEIPPPS